MLVPGVKIRIFHYGCGQYTQLRKSEPKGERTRCPKCGKLASWMFVEKTKINPDFINAWWPTTPEEKIGPGLRKKLQ